MDRAGESIVKLTAHSSNLEREETNRVGEAKYEPILPERFNSTSQPRTVPILPPEFNSTTMPNMRCDTGATQWCSEYCE